MARTSCLLAVGLLTLLGAGCTPRFPDAPRHAARRTDSGGSKAVARAPAVEATGQSALARGPALVLDDDILHGDQSVLEKLQESLASLKQARDANEEGSAKLRAATQRAGAAEADLAQVRRLLAPLTEQLKAQSGVLEKTRAEREAAQAKARDLERQLEPARKGRAEADKLAQQLKDATTEAERLRDQVLQAELARVKADQDLVALQIVMARQQAVLKRRPAALDSKAPAPAQTEAIP